MDKAVKFWGSVAAAIVSTLVLSAFVADARAAAEVRPLENRVTTLEAQRVSDREKLDEIAADVKTLLRRVPARE
jgi:outer membrane murein-binding lipoprotein Lpp